MKTIRLNNRSFDVHKLPMRPNFIRRLSDDFPVPVHELTDAQLKKVGRAWTETLLEEARMKRDRVQA